MLDLTALKPYLPWLNLVLNFIGLVGIPLLIVFRVLKPRSDPKTQMQKKIIQMLTKEANKGEPLFPEIKLRDNLLFQPTSLKHRIFKKKFYELFIESIRDLETEGEIIRMYNRNLEFVRGDEEEEWPAYSSEAKKTPANYGLKEDDPHRYLALNSQEAQDKIRRLEEQRRTDAQGLWETASLNTNLI